MGQSRQQRIISAVAASGSCGWCSVLAPVTEFLLGQCAGPELGGQMMNRSSAIYLFFVHVNALVATLGL